MQIKQITQDKTQVINSDTNDVVVGNILYRGMPAANVMVTAESDLANLPDDYPAGTIAFTAGYKDIWQLDASGSWISVL